MARALRGVDLPLLTILEVVGEGFDSALPCGQDWSSSTSPSLVASSTGDAMSGDRAGADRLREEREQGPVDLIGVCDAQDMRTAVDLDQLAVR